MAALVALVAAPGWYLLPVAVWHLYLAQGLRSAENAERLRVETVREFPAPPADWQRLRLGNLSMMSPPIEVIPPECGSGKDICFLEFEAGTISLFQEGYLEPYREMINFRAPDERDLSVLRSPGENWATIQALRVRVLTSRSRLDSSRFESGTTKGVVAHTTRDGVERYVVAAYSLDEALSRGVGVSGLSEEAFHQVLGGLELFPR
jgi:hypothetical protein